MAAPYSSSKKSGQTTWARESKLYLDTSISRGKTTTEEENSYLNNLYGEFDKNGATDYAKEIAEILEEHTRGSAIVEKSKKLAAQTMAKYISEQEGSEKENSDTIKRIDEDTRQ